MAKRIRSGLKRLRQAARRTAQNQAVRSRLKTAVKRAGSGTSDDLLLALKTLDKAAAGGIIHKNAAARRKARLIRRQRAKAS